MSRRYSDITVASSRKNYAAMAMKGYVIAAQNFRGHATFGRDVRRLSRAGLG